MNAAPTYQVLIGRPSWHQARAGATCSSIMGGFSTLEAAEAWARAYTERHKEPASACATPTTKGGAR